MFGNMVVILVVAVKDARGVVQSPMQCTYFFGGGGGIVVNVLFVYSYS